MIQTNNLFPLPIYPGTVSGQAYWQSKKWWAAGKVYPLYYPCGYLPPFQVEIPPGNEVQGIDIYDANTGEVLFGIDDTDAQTLGTKVGNQWIQYGTHTTPDSFPEGRYYLMIVTDEEFYVSEVWTAVGNLTPFLKLEWWDNQNLVTEQGTIIYDGIYKNIIYIGAELAKPEYVFDEEGEERDGLFYPEKMISTKKYHFSFLAPEYLLDALRFVRLSDNIRVTANWVVPSGPAPRIVYNCDSFLLTPEWVEAGDLATVAVEFTAGTVAKKIAR